MKRYLLLLTLTLAAAPGCVSADGWSWKQASAPAPKPAPAPPPSVLPEEITETNARQKLDALRTEIEYDVSERPVYTVEAPPKP